VAYVAVNMESLLSWQPDTDTLLRNNSIAICGNDYTSSNRYALRSLFVTPTGANPDPRPGFLAINCLSNSPTHARRQVLINEFSNGGGAFDFSADINRWKNALDAVQAPPPRMTNVRLTNGVFQFTFPGQRGRTNRVEGTTNFVDWTMVTNVFGTNAPILFREIDVLPTDRRFYRIRRF